MVAKMSKAKNGNFWISNIKWFIASIAKKKKKMVKTCNKIIWINFVCSFYKLQHMDINSNNMHLIHYPWSQSFGNPIKFFNMRTTEDKNPMNKTQFALIFFFFISNCFSSLIFHCNFSSLKMYFILAHGRIE